LDSVTDELKREGLPDPKGKPGAAASGGRPGSPGPGQPSPGQEAASAAAPGQPAGSGEGQASSGSADATANASAGPTGQGGAAGEGSATGSPGQGQGQGRARGSAPRLAGGPPGQAGGGAGGGGGATGDALSLGALLGAPNGGSGGNGGRTAPSGAGPLTGGDYGAWSDRLRDVEEIVDSPDLRNAVAEARERARLLRQDYTRNLKKPDWAVIQREVAQPLIEVRNRISDELARRGSRDSLVPIDRDPVPNRYAESVRKYYEQLGGEQ
jgi:hypothetical protein